MSAITIRLYNRGVHWLRSQVRRRPPGRTGEITKAEFKAGFKGRFVTFDIREKMHARCVIDWRRRSVLA